MNELSVLERNGQRVLTTQQLADFYSSDVKLLNRNFERNKDRYQEGKHYFSLSGEDLKDFKGQRQNDDTYKFTSILYLWTEQGALLHAKSLNTDKAWEVYSELVETYFRVKEVQAIPRSLPEALRLAADLAEKNMALEQERQLLLPKADFFDAVAESKDAIDIGSAAKVLNMGIGRNKLFEILRSQEVLMQNNQPYQKYIDSGYFRTIEQKYTKPDGSISINIKTLVYQKGLDYIRKIVRKEA